jgi:hypothetical protein
MNASVNSRRRVCPHDQSKEAGTYSVLVKVIDILGNDTTKAMQVVVASQ